MKLDAMLIVHPSRGRVDMAAKYSNELMSNRVTGTRMRYVFSLDKDDPAVPLYMARLTTLPFSPQVLVENNPSVVAAVNRAAATLADEDVLVNMSDDISSSHGWDARLLQFIAGIQQPEYLVQPTDMPNGTNIPVVQILSSALYHRLGYILPTCYQSMYADQDLLESCRKLGAVYPCTGLGFDHLHPNFGKGTWDATYARENHPDCYAAGLITLEKRRKDNFGLK